MKKSYKLLLAFLLFFTICYIGTWFVASREIKNYFSEMEKKTGTNIVKFEGLSITGFPFNIKVRVDQLQYINTYMNNAKIEVETESAKFKTNILFNKITFSFPKRLKIKTILDGNPKSFKVETKGNNEIEVKQRNLFNTVQIIENLYNKTNDILQKIEISEINNKIDEISLYDMEDNSLIVQSSNIFKAFFYNKDKITNLELAIDNNIKLIDPSQFGIDFGSFNSSFDSIVKYNQGDIFSVNEFLLKKSSFQLDDFKLEIIGLVKKEKNKFDIDLTIKIDKLNSLLEKLRKQQFINLQQSIAIEQLVASITGTNYTNKCEFKLYTSKENEIRFGHLDFNNVINYIQLFMMSK